MTTVRVLRERSPRERCPATSNKLFWLDRFLAPVQCESIVQELAFAFWQPSKVYRQTDQQEYGYAHSDKRLSSSTSERWFSAPLRRAMRQIDRRISRILPEFPDHREEWQATQYRRGDRFDYHLDSGYFAGESSGERTHTVMIYLETPREGGATRFPRLDIDVRSEAGRLVVWRNLAADGTSDPDMLHASVPVRQGRKTILVTWIRQRPCISMKPGGT